MIIGELKEVPQVLFNRFVRKCEERGVTVAEGIIECLDWFLSKD